MKAQKRAARLLGQPEAAEDGTHLDRSAGGGSRQAHSYAPTPGEIAYVAYDASRGRAGYGILVSPCGYSPRGLWYADRLPGRWATEEEAQRALDDLAGQEGWRYTRLGREGARA